MIKNKRTDLFIYLDQNNHMLGDGGNNRRIYDDTGRYTSIYLILIIPTTNWYNTS